jgi:hypothetical protein
MTPFYLNIVIHLFYISMIALVLPESLSKEARTILKKNAKLASDAQKRKDTLTREWENETPAAGLEVADPFLTATPGSIATNEERPTWSRRFSTLSRTGAHEHSSKRQKRIRGLLRRAFKKSTAFLQPLGVFMPTTKEDGRTDWNMTIMGASMFTMSTMMVSRLVWVVKGN